MRFTFMIFHDDIPSRIVREPEKALHRIGSERYILTYSEGTLDDRALVVFLVIYPHAYSEGTK